MTIDQMKSLYVKAKTMYYYGHPILDDQQFDRLESKLKELEPSWDKLHQIGEFVPEDTILTRVKNRISTNSLRKVESEKELIKWYNDCGSGPLTVELKADGATCIIYYKNGYFDQAVTRGGDDGVGEDVTKNAVNFKGIPKVLMLDNKVINFTGGVRGEAVLLYDDYKKIDPDMVGNVRNVGNGIMRRIDGVNSGLLTFLAFNYEGDDLSVASEFQKLKLLESLGFTVMTSKHCETIEEAIAVWKDTATIRDTLNHKIDGIVFKIDSVDKQNQLGISSGKPKGEVVLKFDAPGAITTVKDVVITLGHTGVIKPTAVLETVVIDNTNVSNAQLNNWDIIDTLDIAIGDKVTVIKAKDIIPQITDVVERSPTRKLIPRPTECPFCHGPVGNVINSDGSPGIDIECKNPDCKEKVVQRIENWIDKQNILYIGDSVLRAMIDHYDMKSPACLYRVCTHENLNDLSSLIVGKSVLGSNADRIVEQVQKTRKLSLKQFLGGLSIRYLGRRRVELIQQACGGQMDTLDDWRSDKLKSLAAQSSIIAMVDVIVEDINRQSSTIDELLKYIEIVDDVQPVQASSNLLSGKVFVFTGKILKCDENGVRFTREKMHQVALNNGAAVDDKIKKSTASLQYVLVQADPSSTSSKTEDAKKKGANIISEDEFFKLVGM